MVTSNVKFTPKTMNSMLGDQSISDFQVYLSCGSFNSNIVS